MKHYKSMFFTFLLSMIVAFVGCDKKTNNGPKGTFKVTIENVGEAHDIVNSGNVAIPEGDTEAGPLTPGKVFELEFKAPKGTNISLASMFGQSNDWFYATGSSGIALYNSDGSQVTGDVTDQFMLYDAGTEMNQEPGVGDNQAPRQSAPNTGPADDNMNVREVMDNDLPDVSDVIKVTLSSTGAYSFKLRIENVSDSNTLQTSEGGKPAPVSPFVFAVHSPNVQNVLFETGMPDYGHGLEALAEDGNPGPLTSYLENQTGITVPLSPGVFAIYSGDNPIFMSGSPDFGDGLEAIAEDGNPSMLDAALKSIGNVKSSDIFQQADQADSPGPLLPGQTFSFKFLATRGDKLTFATMYAQSNDVFYAPAENGIQLFENGRPVTGDVTDQVMLWDAGTEMNEMPGFGPYQAPRQDSPDTGPADSNDNVRPVDDGYTYPGVIKVTIKLVR